MKELTEYTYHFWLRLETLQSTQNERSYTQAVMISQRRKRNVQEDLIQYTFRFLYSVYLSLLRPFEDGQELASPKRVSSSSIEGTG